MAAWGMDSRKMTRTGAYHPPRSQRTRSGKGCSQDGKTRLRRITEKKKPRHVRGFCSCLVQLPAEKPGSGEREASRSEHCADEPLDDGRFHSGHLGADI